MSDEVQKRLQELASALGRSPAPKPAPRPPKPAPRPAAPAPVESSDTGRFACPVCAGRFPSLGDKKRHMRTRHP